MNVQCVDTYESFEYCDECYEGAPVWYAITVGDSSGPSGKQERLKLCPEHARTLVAELSKRLEENGDK